MVTERCRGCFYVGAIGNAGPEYSPVCCDYMLITGKKRPCPSGDKCTEYTPMQRPPMYMRRRYHHWEAGFR